MNDSIIDLPSHDDALAAQIAVDAFRPFAAERGPTSVRLLGASGAPEVEVRLPSEALHVLIRALTHMANGHAVTLLPVRAELTTQQAADLLGVSRPHLVGLLEAGKIAFHRVGTHRRVRAVDVLAWRKQRRAESERLLDELAADAQELDLGY
ncbi:MAG: helix-turn-helix domain-containing protein [Myxococcales bacterium]|nr:helix-turn-helix domain-containing protein [Myxococcales bacterium]